MKLSLARRAYRRLFPRPPIPNPPLSIPLPYDSAGQYLESASLPTIGTNLDASGVAGVRFDNEGIPIVRYGDLWAHNPVTTALKGLQEFSRWKLDASAERLAYAVTAGEWLCKHQDPVTGKWSYDFDFPVPGIGSILTAPWSSAMAQGLAMSLLTRLYRTTSRDAYLAHASAACLPLELDVGEGGLRADFFGHPFLEEYPTDPPSFVLNGFMFTLLGLHDLSTCDDTVAPLFATGMRTLVHALPFYDTTRISAYHLGHITSPPRRVHTDATYHLIHIKQLMALNSIWPHETLAFYAREWSAGR